MVSHFQPERLVRRKHKKARRVFEYTATLKVCGACPLKKQSTRSEARTIRRHEKGGIRVRSSNSIFPLIEPVAQTSRAGRSPHGGLKTSRVVRRTADCGSVDCGGGKSRPAQVGCPPFALSIAAWAAKAEQFQQVVCGADQFPLAPDGDKPPLHKPLAAAFPNLPVSQSPNLRVSPFLRPSFTARRARILCRTRIPTHWERGRA